jgi:hypothetical protein
MTQPQNNVQQESKNESYDRLKKERSKLTHISFSEFTLYKNCPHQHLVLKHLGIDKDDPSIHLYFGNCIHESFEYALRDRKDIEFRVKKFREDFYKQMVDNMKGLPGFEEVYSFLDQGENIIRTFNTDELVGSYDVVSVEEDLYEKLSGRFYFKGFIDLVLRNKKNGRYLIVDWKTSGQKWDVNKKKKDEIFMCQMRFYKFFWARKHEIDIDEIDCQYIVLNRLVNKKKPGNGFGVPQYVPIESTLEELEYSLTMLAGSVKGIHIDNYFPKVKNTNPDLKFKNPGCLFCKYKGNKHFLCNGNENQYKQMLIEHKF